ncbi:MAG: fumarate reductase subunit C [Planctomycetota bacterium]|jgi:fumarate reductase subunit C
MTKPYIRPMPATWYLKTAPYRRFMVRELTSFFMAGYLVFLLVVLARLDDGPEAYQALLSTLRSPLSVIGHGLALLAALFHSISWFILTPKAMVIRIGEERVPSPLVAIAAGYGPWLVVSAIILWGVLR